MDEAWKDRLSRHLAVLTEEGALDVWDDRRIGAGATWEEEIRAAMDAADVAILLISADFLTSRFVLDSEIPHLLQRRAENGVRVIPVLVHSCLWKQVEWIAALQVHPRDGKPLASLRGDRVDEELVALAEEVLQPPPPPPPGHPEGELREQEGSGGREGAAREPVASAPALRPQPRRPVAAPHPGLRWSAVAALLLAMALLVGGLFPRRGPVALAALAVSAGALILGAWLYSAAVHTGEVRRLDPAGDAPPVSIAGTQGATGVAWLDPQTLLVTMAEAGAKLLRVPLEGKPAVVWSSSADDGLTAAAPLALPGGKIAFVRQRPPGQEPTEGHPVAVLSLCIDGRIDPTRNVVLPFRIQQLLASSADGRQILALNLGIGENLPTFLQIDLAERTVQNLGYDNTLYQIAFRSPHSDVSVISLEDNSGRKGWSLALVDGRGKLIKDLQARKQDDLLPVWQPAGKGLAYVAEVEAKAAKQ